jgi:hypothetical protein
MPGLTVSVVLQDVKKLEADALIVGFYEDVRPLKGLAGELDWLLCGSLSDLIIKNKVRGSLGDVALLTSRGKVPAKKIFMIGLGPRDGLSSSSLRSAVRTAVTSASGAGVKKSAIEYFQPSTMSHEDSVRALHTGLSEGAGQHSIDVSLLAPDAAVYEKIARLLRR